MTKLKSLKSAAKVNEVPRRKPAAATLAAYAYWVKNPSATLTEVAEKHSILPEGLRAYIRRENLESPDGKSAGQSQKKSERQLWIAKAYKLAVKKNWTARDASIWVEEQAKCTCQRGDIQYYAMKNDLPYLPEAADARNLPKTPDIK
jgi:hypothetical protein